MIIVASDIHLGYEKSDEKGFKNFVIRHIAETLNSQDHLVLLGDIFDFWRKRNLECMLKSDDLLGAILKLETNVHYVIGNHDYVMFKIKNRYKEYQTFDIKKYLRLEDKGTKLFLTHGYDLDAYVNYEPLTIWDYEKLSEELCRTGNAVGRILGELWGISKKMRKPPEKRKHWKREPKNSLLPKKTSDLNRLELFACSEGKKIFLGMQKNEKLVFGHTHRPFIVENTANTGSWVKDTSQEYERSTYVKIENGEITLMQWKNGKEQLVKATRRA